MNPIIKYRGGKSKEIPYFVKNMPNKYARYIEPFLVVARCIFICNRAKQLSMILTQSYIVFIRNCRKTAHLQGLN